MEIQANHRKGTANMLNSHEGFLRRIQAHAHEFLADEGMTTGQFEQRCSEALAAALASATVERYALTNRERFLAALMKQRDLVPIHDDHGEDTSRERKPRMSDGRQHDITITLADGTQRIVQPSYFNPERAEREARTLVTQATAEDRIAARVNAALGTIHDEQ
jgi:hypothetical protein